MVDTLSYSYYADSLRFSIASTIIIFPLFLVLSWYQEKQTNLIPEKKFLVIRKWFTYLTLFLAGAIIVGDLVFLLNTFLGGEIAIRFILKVVALALVLGLVFAYYIYDLRNDGIEKRKSLKNIAIAAVVVFLVVIIGGFITVGSPIKARNISFDSQKVSDLQAILSQADSYYTIHKTVATDISQLTSEGYTVPKDAQTALDYNYSYDSSKKVLSV